MEWWCPAVSGGGGQSIRLEYRSPVEYLTNVGFIPKTLAEIGLESGSVSGAQAPLLQERLER